MIDKFIVILREGDTHLAVYHSVGACPDHINTFFSETEAKAYIANFYKDYQPNEVIYLKLSETQIDLANLVCVYFDNIKAAEFILKLDDIGEMGLSEARNYLNRLFEGQNPQRALTSLDGFFAKHGVCQIGDFYNAWQRDKEWANMPFGLNCESGE
ncbi:hypothetical protein [Moraxella catarrhalis]|jgi:hypothetical protein|uniref:hypothetical protein n=1 Tax=Moraxella catarrhalis TaxID=480 RepID=UPI00128B1962|nr:hypothetical protein [Moraxella catarrhalis]MPY08999.1 hypothetical protein [Moraxella catarrhalis]